ncbi:MAG: ComEC/Rec2 family competence protein [Lentisphaeria bacterium]|nr:ComEC/Rec2 family competence protein [Lentisphaeria bacterium]
MPQDISTWPRIHLMTGRTTLFPMLPVALGMVTGIVGTASFSLTQRGVFWGCLSTLTTLALALAWDRESRFRLLGGVITGVLLAFLHLWAPWQSYQRHVVAHSAATLTVRVTDPFADPGPFGFDTRRPRILARMRDMTLTGETGITPCRGKILLVMPAATAVEYGDTLRVEGVFTQPEPPTPSGAFDYRRFLLAQGIQHVFRVETLARQPGVNRLAALKRRVYAGRRTLAAHLTRGFTDNRPARAAAAMTLGYRGTLDEETRRQFIRSGTIHVFSISGLHVGIATTVFLLAARLMGVPLMLRFRLLPMVLGVYVFVTGSPISAVRAWVMISAFSLSFSCFRPPAPLNGVGLAAVALLLINPLAVFNTGFQFSFTVVIALIVGWRLVGEIVSVSQEKRRWRRPLSKVDYRVGKLIRLCLVVFGCGLTAWLGSAGLLAWNNCLFIPAALWLNVAVAFLAFASLALAFGKLALICVGLSGIAGPLTWSLETCLELVQSLVAAVARGDGCLAIPQPRLWLVSLYYGALLLALVPGSPVTWRKIAVGGVVLCLMWMGYGNRMIQRDHCVIIHGGGGGMTACFVEDRPRPPVLILAGDYQVDMAALDMLTMRGHDTVRAALCPRYGHEAEQSVDMVLNRLRVERLVVTERFKGGHRARTAVSVFHPSGNLTRGSGLPPGVEVERLSRKETRVILRDVSAGKRRLAITWSDKSGMTRCRLSAEDRTLGTRSLPHTRRISVYDVPL